MVGINQKGPGQACLLNVRFGHEVGVKGNDGNVDVSFFELQFVLTQLRHMVTARQSAQMPMKHQQQPTALIVSDLMLVADDVR